MNKSLAQEGKKSMSLVKLTNLLADAQKGKYGVGMFVMFDMEMLHGLILAAEETRSPIIIAYGELAEEQTSIRHFSKTVRSMVEAATVPIALHWDHASSYEVAKLAVDSGFTSVMIDASSRPLAENIAITKSVVELCRPLGIDVEGELGCVGQGAQYDLNTYQYTNADDAVQYVRESGVDALAVAIGNSHGMYACAPKINFDVLADIRAKVSVPLVLHGASGIPDVDIKASIEGGITKINIFTDLCIEATQRIRNTMKNERVGLEQVAEDIIQGVKAKAMEKIFLFGSDGKVR